MKTKIKALDVVAVIVLMGFLFFPHGLVAQPAPIDESKLERFPAHPSHPLDRPNALAIEYRIETHVKAMARKLGKLNRIFVWCGNNLYQEDALADLLSNNLQGNLTDDLLIKAKGEYEKARPDRTPNCGNRAVIDTLAAEISRHEDVIFNASTELTVLKDGGSK